MIIFYCTLCHNNKIAHYCGNDGIPYYNCPECGLIFVPVKYHLSLDEEKKRYDCHENDPADLEYQKFLGQLVEQLIEKLPKGAGGLDYGCGPGPAVSIMMEKMGFAMANYDPFYANDSEILNETYDFVTCTEVVEHFRNPANDWESLLKLVKKGGCLGIMTEFTDDIVDFEKWYYRRDPTHVALYSKNTFEWIAEEYNLELTIPGDRVILLKKL